MVHFKIMTKLSIYHSKNVLLFLSRPVLFENLQLVLIVGVFLYSMGV
jgi:hypothetical protein